MDMTEIIEVVDNQGQSLLCAASLWVHIGWKAFVCHAGNGSFSQFRDNKAALPSPQMFVPGNGRLTHI